KRRVRPRRAARVLTMAERDGRPLSWEEILSEPMTSVRDEGWRAVQSLAEMSPRPQQPALTLEDASGWRSLPLPPEQEETESDRLPASLAEQLSLTWAARRRRRAWADHELEPAPEAAFEETAGPGEFETGAQESPGEVLSPQAPRTSVWRRPAGTILRL